MRKRKTYKNFQEYSTNDPKYLMRALRGELHKPQAKITFEDGSYYNVTRAGNRWWGKNGMIHREDGPSGILKDGCKIYFINMVKYAEEDYWKEIERRKSLTPDELADEDMPMIDITPLIIELEDDKWLHPFIKDYYEPDEQGYDTDVYRIYFKNDKNQMLYVYFKSTYIDRKSKLYFEQEDWEDKPKMDIFQRPFIDVMEVYQATYLTLVEDFWGPIAPNNGPVNHTPESLEWFKENPNNQFCFSKFGEKVNEFFNNEAEVDFFTLDCGLTTDGKEWWCDS